MQHARSDLPARDYAGILKAEVDSALRHILSYRPWPFFFHQANLKNYGAGKTLQFDWLNAVVGEYEELQAAAEEPRLLPDRCRHGQPRDRAESDDRRLRDAGCFGKSDQRFDQSVRQRDDTDDRRLAGKR